MKTVKIVLAAAVIGIAAYFAVAYFVRAGHGTYIPLFVFFPFSILFGPIGEVPSLVAVFGQFPAYGLLFSWGLRRNKKSKFLWGILLVHVFAVVAAVAGIGAGIIS